MLTVAHVAVTVFAALLPLFILLNHRLNRHRQKRVESLYRLREIHRLDFEDTVHQKAGYSVEFDLVQFSILSLCNQEANKLYHVTA
jgi:hypothetical protein